MREGTIGLETTLDVLLVHYFQKYVDGDEGNAPQDVIELLKAIDVIVHHIEIHVHPQHLP